MKRANLVLLSALLWIAWHLGTLSVPSANVPGHPQESRESGIKPAVKRFTWESERLLGTTAQTLERDSGEIWREVHNSPSVRKWGSHQENFTPATQSGFTSAWRQVEPLMVSIRPVVQAGWDMVQSGWHRFLDDKTSSESATATSGKSRSNLHLPGAHSLQNDRLAEQSE